MKSALLFLALVLHQVLASEDEDQSHHVVVFRQPNFSNHPPIVLINGVKSPDVLYHNNSAISFIVPSGIVKDSLLFGSSVVDITVGKIRYKNIPLRTLKPAIVEVHYKSFRSQVIARRSRQYPPSPSAQHDTEEHNKQIPSGPHTLKQPNQQQNPSASPLDDKSKHQSQSKPLSNLQLHIDIVQDPFSSTSDLKSSYAALLQQAREHEDTSAMHALAVATLSHTPHSPISRSVAISFLRRSTEAGNPHAQAEMAFLHATGLAEPDIIKHEPSSLLYWTLAAHGGSLYASMALGHRNRVALSVPENCKLASGLYKAVASITVPKNAVLKPLVRSLLIPSSRQRLHERTSSNNLEEYIEYVQHTANRGDSVAQLEVAKVLMHRKKGDIDQARELFEKAAVAGNTEAHSLLGYIYMQAERYELAIHHLKRAARGDNANALHALGFAHLHGIGVPVNAKAAAVYFEKVEAKEHRHPDSLYILAIMAKEGTGVTKSASRALRLFKAAAEMGNLQASYMLALFYLADNTPGEYDCVQAVKNLKKVAESGKWESYLRTAKQLYEKGLYGQSLYRYLKAAHAGLEIGQYNAGFMYEKNIVNNGGTKVELSKKQRIQNSIDMYGMSAGQGEVSSLVRIGDLAFGEIQDYSQAAGAYEKAGNEGHAEALFNLGWMHARGFGMPPDRHMAMRYFDRAKERDLNAWLPATIASFGLKYYDEFVDVIVNIGNKGLDLIRNSRVAWMDMVLISILLGVLIIVVNIRQKRLLRIDEDEGIEDVNGEVEEQNEENGIQNEMTDEVE